MQKMILKWMYILLAVNCFGLTSCTEPPPVVPEYVLKTSFIQITPEAFAEELDLKMAAYPYNIKDQPAEYNDMVIHLVTVLSEELVLLSAAKDKGITVSEADQNMAETAFRRAYPEGSFDRMLLKNAISYPLWKKRFKKNMIIERIIDRELTQKIEISPDEIVEFYQNNKTDKAKLLFRKTGENPGGKKPEGLKEERSDLQNEERLISRLKMKKTQEAYDAWMQQLWNDYPVEIGKNSLKTFLIDTETGKGRQE
ncbi:MAG: hypothetical protein MI862_27675 [Desulfobacterales bacterium]|nr:hypothetical protein [Desulfobacterales bacterium]